MEERVAHRHFLNTGRWHTSVLALCPKPKLESSVQGSEIISSEPRSVLKTNSFPVYVEKSSQKLEEQKPDYTVISDGKSWPYTSVIYCN